MKNNLAKKAYTEVDKTDYRSINYKEATVLTYNYYNYIQPKLIKDILRFFNRQKNLFNDQQIARAKRDKKFPFEWYDLIINAVDDFIQNTIISYWKTGINKGFKLLSDSTGFDYIELKTERQYLDQLNEWMNERSIVLAETLSKSEIESVKTMVTKSGAISFKNYKKELQNTVGLTPSQSTALQTFSNNTRQKLEEQGIRGKALDDIVSKQTDQYSQYLTSVRAENIARTELSLVVNNSKYALMKQWIDEGKFGGTVVKKFWTATDERVCAICEPWHGQVIGFENKFTGKGIESTIVPPLHPRCRCGIIYQVQSPLASRLRREVGLQ